MGMYTEIRTNLILGPHTPPEVLECLQVMIDPNRESPEDWHETNDGFYESLEHEFFWAGRWPCLFTMGSAYFPTKPWAALTPILEVVEDSVDGIRRPDQVIGYRLTSCSNLKNYDNEIAKFADWIRRFCLPQKEPIVVEQYEENDYVTEYYQDGTFK
jgi:hypothetical protein